MRPVPIPDEMVWPGGRRIVVSPPGGDLLDDRIRAVEAVVDLGSFNDMPRFCLRIALDDGDLAKLADNPHFWLTVHGEHLHPFALVIEADQ